MLEEIGRITRLDEGFILTINGRNIVAKDAKELARQVQKNANRKAKPQGLPPHAGVPPEGAWMGPTVPVQPVQSQNPPANWDELRKRDDRNISKLITARLANQISDEDVLRGAAETVKTYSAQEVADFLLEASRQFFMQADQASKPNKDGLLGDKCSCPACPQNVSYPNHLGQCVSCFSGEHLHPMEGSVPNGSGRAPVTRDDPGRDHLSGDVPAPDGPDDDDEEERDVTIGELPQWADPGDDEEPELPIIPGPHANSGPRPE